jgi:hypothetical protein
MPACLLIASGGCGPRGPAVYPVSGTLTISGQPAANVQVVFMPVDPSHQVAIGRSDANGLYALTWGSTNRNGAEQGRYKVVLNQLETETDSETTDKYSAVGNRRPPKPPVAQFPAEYSAADTSPKEVEVSTGSNTINIEL